MKITPGVELPEELLTAARAGELVLFVGAGASMGGKSGLPDFNELARQVANRVGGVFDGDEPADAFLGRLSNEFPQVRDIARDIIARPSSSANDTHRGIARLAAATSASVVTTNYDEHITTAAAAENLVLGETFNAPAVPLARSFRGVVHLHGAVSRPTDDLVLTDADFGRAYLTDGWARRFVQDLFTNRTVLFIGYSHNDVVVTYLARGLPPNTRRFVLTDKPENPRWNDLRIEAIGYSSADDHKALPEALEAWATLQRMGHLDHHERVRSIVRGGPPKIPDEADYLAYAITVPSGVRAFAKSATGPEWLRWAETQPPFQQLFDPGIEMSESGRVLTGWFSETYAMEPARADLAMRVLARYGPLVNPYLRYELSIRSARMPKEHSRLARQWGLIVSAAMSTAHRTREFWFQTYGHDDLSSSELLPFVREAVAARLTLAEERSWFSQEGTDESTRLKFGIAWIGDKSDMGRLLERVRADLVPVAAQVVQVLEQAIANAYEILEAFDEDHFDSWSFRRSAIEPHAQDENRDIEDELIDTLRDAASIQQRVDASIRPRWFSSPHALLRRLAVHLLREDEARTANQKIEELLQGPGVYDRHLKHEVFTLVASTAADLDDTARGKFLAAVLEGPPAFNTDEETNARLRERVMFDLLEWTSRHVSGWQELEAELSNIRAGRPEIGVRPHADFDSWMESGTWGGNQPMDTSDFVELAQRESAGAAIRALMDHDFSERNFGGSSISDACTVVTAAVRSHPELGRPLVDALVPTPFMHQQDLLAAVLEGWENGSLNDTEADVAATTTDSLYSRGDLVRPTARLCLSLVNRETGSRPEPLLTLTGKLINSIWTDEAGQYETGSWTDPLTEALNTWPGAYAQYWLHRISLRWRMSDNWNGLSDDEKAGLDSILNDFGPVHRPALAILAADLLFLFASDEAFVTSKVFPLFDPTVGGDRAALMWSAFLHNPRVDDALLDAGFWAVLLRGRAANGGAAQRDSGQQYWRLIAAASIYSSAQAVDRSALLQQLSLPADQPDLLRLLEALRAEVSDLELDRRPTAWGWIQTEWKSRVDSSSGGQSPEERTAWGDLGLALGELAPQSLIVSATAPGPLSRNSAYSDIPEPVLRAHAEEFVRDATRRGQLTTTADWSVQHELSSLFAVVGSLTPPKVQRAFAEVAVGLGIHQAASWTT